MIILAHCGNGYCGCDSDEVFFFDDETSEAIINESIYDISINVVVSYITNSGKYSYRKNKTAEVMTPTA